MPGTLEDELRRVAQLTVRQAGPRYSPGVDPTAPNLEVEPLVRVAAAACLGLAYAEGWTDLEREVRAVRQSRGQLHARVFGRRAVNLDRISARIRAVVAASSETVGGELQNLQADARRVVQHLSAARSVAEAELAVAQRARAAGGASGPADAEIERFRGHLDGISELLDPVAAIDDLLAGPEGRAARGGSVLLLTGDWGTGKTHFVCDIARQMLDDGTPAVAVLATGLRDDVPVLDAVAEATGLATDGAELIDRLTTAARAAQRRAVIIIDAINEADRSAWRRRLPRLIAQARRLESVTILVTCRTPFDQLVVPERVRRLMMEVEHLGFTDDEFDAQLEFFAYYQLPPLHVPLLDPEFSRPLFLRLLCEGMKRLVRSSQTRQLKDIASGQKGMTFVLENFVKHVGAEVESKHGLASKACWNILKGHRGQGRPGLAGILAEKRREWLSLDETLEEVRQTLAVDAAAAEAVVADMIGAGLLLEQARYVDGGYTSVLVLPYQRFSDHLVARHLLLHHLDTSSAAAVRRSFYKNRRLGAAFIVERWSDQFAEPGVASALMIEFPERVRRLAGAETLSIELLWSLPRDRRLFAPVADAFLSGLYWRNASSFSEDTRHLVGQLITRTDSGESDRALEVLTGLAARDQHPWNARWLWDRLAGFTMPERDLTWSEFLRHMDPSSNLNRLIAWAEHTTAAAAPPAGVENAVRLLMLGLTTTDRLLRDRLTRALVLLGDAHPRELFTACLDAIGFGDQYVGERALAASYGVAMRGWAEAGGTSPLADALEDLAGDLFARLVRPTAPHATWHALTRGYAVGLLRILLQLRPRALSRSDRALVVPKAPGPPSPFRDPSAIHDADIQDADDAIQMDFGNYTLGRLVDGRRNYDFNDLTYVPLRRQIADRIRDLGWTTQQFGTVDRFLGRTADSSRHHVDRYGKKYSWIAYFEMYGLRAAAGQLEDYPDSEPRPSDSDIDPSFPDSPPQWHPPGPNPFATAPTELPAWLASGQDPGYAAWLQLESVDANAGEWILLDATIHEEAGDGRELRGFVSSFFVPKRAVPRLVRELAAGHHFDPSDLDSLGGDYYTYHGEVPWSPTYGSDVRTAAGAPRRLRDRLTLLGPGGVRREVVAERTTRSFSWESYHSELNQTQVVFPAPPIADHLGLTLRGGSSDLFERSGPLASAYRESEGPGYGSHYLYMRRDLVQTYCADRGLHLVQAVWGARSVSHRLLEGRLPEDLLESLQSGAADFSSIHGLSP